MAKQDEPVGTRDGRKVYDNTATVVCLLVPSDDRTRLLTVRRKNSPGKGLIGLPGGFQMWGESWQSAGQREVYEETGYIVRVRRTEMPFVFKTDEYQNNLLIAKSSPSITRHLHPGIQDEVEEVLWFSKETLPLPNLWAFPLHYQAARDFLKSL